MSYGLWGATQAEKIPANIIAKMMTKLTAPSGCCQANSTIALRRRGIGSDAGSALEDIVMASAVADARIEQRVEQIDHEIGEHVKYGDQHHHALDQGEVVT